MGLESGGAAIGTAVGGPAGGVVGAGIGAGLDMIGGVAGGIFGSQNAQRENQYQRDFALQQQWRAHTQNVAMQHDAQAFTERMSNTAYQRATKDMVAAGINPMLAYMQGGASTPSGGGPASGGTPMGTSHDPGKYKADMMKNLMNSAVSVYKGLQEAKQVNENTKLIGENIKLAAANAGLSREQAGKAAEEASNLRVRTIGEGMANQILEAKVATAKDIAEAERTEAKVRAKFAEPRQYIGATSDIVGIVKDILMSVAAGRFGVKGMGGAGAVQKIDAVPRSIILRP